MKRKLITLFSLVLIAAMMTSVLVGCSFFRENDYRVANETYVTVNHENGISLSISYNEILDYCNGSSRLYTYVNYYGLSVAEALDLCIQGKIQSTYLLAEAMGYLTDANAVSAERIAALYGKGAKNKAEDVLTYAERVAAIYAVNESIESSIESYIDEIKAEEWTRAYNKLSNENVKEIVLTDGTKEYLDRFFDGGKGCLVGAELDTSKVKAQIIYNDGSKSEEFVVPSEGYSVEFSSKATDNYTERTEEKNFTVKFTEISFDEDGEEVETEHTAVYDYTLIYPRTVKADEEEVRNYAEIEIDEVKIGRYDNEAIISSKLNGAVPAIMNPQAIYDSLVAGGGDKYEIEAYKKFIDNIASNNRTMDYFYKSQYDSMAITALTEELYLKAEKEFAQQSDIDAKIVAEFKYLYENQKKGYYGMTAEESKDNFVSTVGTSGAGMDTLYYYPAVDDLDEYFFVKQVLFKFDADVLAFLETIRNDKDAVEEACKYFMGTEKPQASNPDYDVDYDCPLHELKEEGATCKHEGQEGVCPSIAFVENEKTIGEVITDIQTALSTLSGDEAKEAFEKYLYTYCDDAGSFNADWGYLIAKEDDDNGWVKNFTDLAKSLLSYNGAEGNAFVASGEIGVSYTYNLTGTTSSDYAGVSIMMISKTPFDVAGVELDFNDQAAIINHLKAQYKGDGTSLYDSIKDGLEQEARSLAYNNFITCIPQDIYERDEEDNKITVNEDYKGVIEINTKKLKKEIYDEYLGK